MAYVALLHDHDSISCEASALQLVLEILEMCSDRVGRWMLDYVLGYATFLQFAQQR